MINLDVAVQEGLNVLQKLIQIDTTAGAARETEAALWLLQRAKHAGFKARIVEPSKGFGSIIVELPGQEDESLLLLSHLDTAPVIDAASWEYPPFSGVKVRDEIWGRGTVDCKGLIAAWWSVLHQMRDLPLRKGIVFASASGEEIRSEFGAKWLLNNCEEIARCKWVLNEGGGWKTWFGNAAFTVCQIGEKGTLRAVISEDMVLERVLRELRLKGKISFIIPAAQPTAYINWLNEGHLGILGKAAAAGGSRMMKRMFDYAQRNSAYRLNTAEMFFHTVTLLPMKEERGLQLICNVLPGDEAEQVLNKALQKISKLNLKTIKRNDFVQMTEYGTPTISTGDDMLYQSLEKIHSSPLFPYISPGRSDSEWFRKAGLPVYGWFPHIEASNIVRMHNDNERISVHAFRRSVAEMFNIVQQFCR